LETEDPVLADDEQVEEHPELRRHRVDRLGALQRSEDLSKLLVDPEPPQEHAEHHQASDARERWVRPTDSNSPGIWSPNGPAPLVAVSSLAAGDVSAHLPGARRALSLFHSRCTGCARRAYFSSRSVHPLMVDRAHAHR